jgi:hypothetical protein
MAEVRLHLLKVTGDIDEKAIVAMFCQITRREATRADIAEVRRELNSMRRDDDVRGES